MADRELGNLWRVRCDQKIESFCQNVILDFKVLVKILWDEAILGRIVPLDPLEKQARQRLEKAVWSGDRDDPILYWRILYSALSVRNAIVRSYTITSSREGYITGALSEFWSARLKLEAEKLTGLNLSPRNPVFSLLDSIMAHAKEELVRLGVTPHDPLIPIDARGQWHGIDVTIEGYSDTGLIHFHAVNSEGHAALYPLFDEGSGVLPNRVDPQCFTNPE